MYISILFIALFIIQTTHSATLSNSPNAQISTAPLRTVQISYDKAYSSPSSTLPTVACSPPPSAFSPNTTTTNSQTQTQLYIAASDLIPNDTSTPSPDHQFCYTCWSLTHTLSDGEQTTITVLAVDSTDSGFVVSPEALDVLTREQAERLGVVKGEASQIDRRNCGL